MILRGDSAAIESLLVAVLDNAFKYTPAGGSVQLQSAAVSREIVIEIEDTGGGIADEDLPRIFDRFFRADRARSCEVAGSGLGLSIARWIADTHKGRIEVESQLGAGSVFRIVLPLFPTAVTTATAAPAQLLDSQAVAP